MPERIDVERRPRKKARLVGACLLVSITAFICLRGSAVMGSRNVEAPDNAQAPTDSHHSRILRVQIDSVESPTFGGREFGGAGRYERLLGRLFGEVDPTDPHNSVIVNIDRAPRNARGMVEYSADFRILKPIDMARGNGTMFYDVANRGNQRALNLHWGLKGAYGSYPPTAEDLGDGFLLEQGYTVVWNGWQGDVEPGGGRLTAQIPIAARPDGSPIRRWITTELLPGQVVWAWSIEYPAVAGSMPEAKLYRRSGPHTPLEAIPRSSWSFATCGKAGGTPVANNRSVCLPAGFSTNYSYHLVYEAQDPLVMGLGFTVIRDFVSFLKHDTTDGNPLVARRGSGGDAPPIRWAIQFGQSQPGRFVRDFVYHGMNRDDEGRRVFDGAISHTAGSRRTFTNFEFAMPGRFSRGVEDHYFPGDQFPFTYETTTDPLTGRVDGLLARCRLTQTCPKIMQWDSASEGWAARDSLVVTDPLGLVDVPFPENVRFYYFSGTEHQAGTGADPSPDEMGNCQLLPNPNPYRDTQRALLDAMQAWVVKGTVPPASQHPKLADGTLVPVLPQAAQGFPSIPGVRYPGKVNDLFVNDYFALPTAHTTAEYRVLVAKVDDDGNEIAGVRSTMHQTPLGTYTPWNLRKAGFMENELCGTSGGYVPFVRRAADRAADPRPSLEERYGTHQRYVELVRAANSRLQRARFLRAPDAERLVREAQQRDLGLPRESNTQR